MEAEALWMMVADSRQAALYRGQRGSDGVLRLEHLETMTNTHEAEHERLRPTLAGGAERRSSIARSGAHAAPHTIAAKHTSEEETDRFAREVIAWAAATRRARGGGRMVLFAPPRFLGLLRRHAGADAPELYEGELTHLRAHELAAHPAALKVLNAS